MYKGSSLHKWQWHLYGAGHAHKQWAASAAGANGMDKAGADLDRTEAGAGLLS